MCKRYFHTLLQSILGQSDILELLLLCNTTKVTRRVWAKEIHSETVEKPSLTNRRSGAEERTQRRVLVNGFVLLLCSSQTLFADE